MAQHPQQPHLQAGLQHLARRRQEDSGQQTASGPQVALVHQHQHQQALVAVQALERQRIALEVQQTAWDQSAQAT